MVGDGKKEKKKKLGRNRGIPKTQLGFSLDQYSRLPAGLHNLGHSFPFLGKKCWTSQSTQLVALRLMYYS
jgi:hypothetical protein